MNDLAISYIRTYVPKLIGLLVGWLAAKGFEIDGTELTIAVIGLIEVLWYGIARALEQKFPWAGALIGYKKAPAYTPPPAPPVIDAPV